MGAQHLPILGSFVGRCVIPFFTVGFNLHYIMFQDWFESPLFPNP